jgi:hypothetical protein
MHAVLTPVELNSRDRAALRKAVGTRLASLYTEDRGAPLSRLSDDPVRQIAELRTLAVELQDAATLLEAAENGSLNAENVRLVRAVRR